MVARGRRSAGGLESGYFGGHATCVGGGGLQVAGCGGHWTSGMCQQVPSLLRDTCPPAGAGGRLPATAVGGGGVVAAVGGGGVVSMGGGLAITVGSGPGGFGCGSGGGGLPSGSWAPPHAGSAARLMTNDAASLRELRCFTRSSYRQHADLRNADHCGTSGAQKPPVQVEAGSQQSAAVWQASPSPAQPPG